MFTLVLALQPCVAHSLFERSTVVRRYRFFKSSKVSPVLSITKVILVLRSSD